MGSLLSIPSANCVLNLLRRHILEQLILHSYTKVVLGARGSCRRIICERDSYGANTLGSEQFIWKRWYLEEPDRIQCDDVVDDQEHAVVKGELSPLQVRQAPSIETPRIRIAKRRPVRWEFSRVHQERSDQVRRRCWRLRKETSTEIGHSRAAKLVPATVFSNREVGGPKLESCRYSCATRYLRDDIPSRNPKIAADLDYLRLDRSA